MTTQAESEPICCPEFDPTLWDDKISEWDKKPFIKDKVFTIFYMPVNFGQVMTRLNDKVTKADAKMPDWLCLSEHTSMWNMGIYLAVDKEIQEAENTTLSGKFYSKVYEGSYNNTGKWTKDFESTVKSKGFKMNKLYMWYTTCPKCAKKYGKNYVVFFSQIE
ncbi:MAG: hypothetical protein KG029_10990 [Bacteroidetes bacterium]|nr:hypothetical protein [Bacteroidota bacterium]